MGVVRLPNRALGILVVAAANAATSPFAARLYPVLDNAGCKSCHHAEGVASGTRLRFPAEGASTEVVEAFGNSLVDLVDRPNPKRSLLLNKPTNRVKHTGGERIKKGSAEEKLLIDWVNRLASFSDAESLQALSYRRAGYGRDRGARAELLRTLASPPERRTSAQALFG